MFEPATYVGCAGIPSFANPVRAVACVPCRDLRIHAQTSTSQWPIRVHGMHAGRTTDGSIRGALQQKIHKRLIFVYQTAPWSLCCAGLCAGLCAQLKSTTVTTRDRRVQCAAERILILIFADFCWFVELQHDIVHEHQQGRDQPTNVDQHVACHLVMPQKTPPVRQGVSAWWLCALRPSHIALLLNRYRYRRLAAIVHGLFLPLIFSVWPFCLSSEPATDERGTTPPRDFRFPPKHPHRSARMQLFAAIGSSGD